MTERILIKNAQLVNEGTVTPGDLMIHRGRIERCDSDITARGSVQVLDATGRYLLPGMIDDQVHFREPGLTHKANIASESRAAVAGGITSYMEMPNTQPPTVTVAALEEKYRIAEGHSQANYAFYFGATNDNLDAVRSLDPATVAGVKVFMGSSTGNMLVDRVETLAGIFRESPVIIATHCESTPRIEQNLKAAMERYGREIPVTEHPVIRDTEACYSSSSLAVSLAREHGAQLHILHLSTAREMDLFAPGPIEGKSITAEVCVHHLQFSSEDYPHYGNLIKCNPAIKSPADRAALLEALKDGRLDIIATDHAPHTREEKSDSDYLQAPSGLPLVQDALLSVLEFFHDKFLTLPEIVTKTSHNPALRFQVRQRGFLREGYHADLVLVDTRASTEVRPDTILSRCGWSPFLGKTFRSRIDCTWVNGVPAWQNGKIVEHRAARRLEFERPRGGR